MYFVQEITFLDVEVSMLWWILPGFVGLLRFRSALQRVGVCRLLFNREILHSW